MRSRLRQAWRRHAVIPLVIVALLAPLVVACQSQPPSASPSGAPPAARTSAGPTAALASQPTEAPKPVRGGTLTFGLDLEPLTLDPAPGLVVPGLYIALATGESLVYLDEHRELKPWLAEAWEVADGGTSFTFKLRKDVIFQDGTPFNAAAVKWNFDRIVAPTYQGGAAASYLAGYQGTDIVDEFTARVRFGSPHVPFLVFASSIVFAMLSPSATTRQGDEFNHAPVMTGPYKVDEWVPKDHITISRWDGYTRRSPWSDHDGAGYLDKVVWKLIPDASARATAVESGEVQAVALSAQPDTLRLKSAGLQILSAPWGGQALSLHLNVTRPPTDDLRVRQAIAYAIDRESQLTVYDGTTAVGPLTKVLLDDPSLRDYYPRDLAKARQLLEQAGWAPGADGVRARGGERLEFVLNAVSDIAASGGPYPLIQAQLREAGIDVAVKAQAVAAFTEDNSRCANNGVLGFVRSNELDVLYTRFHSSNAASGARTNVSCLKDAEIDRMLEQGRREVDPTRRKQLYLDISKKLLDMAVVVPLVDQLNVFALRPNVHGLKFNGHSYPLVTDLYLQP